MAADLPRRLALRALLSLPGAVLRALSGGGVVWVGGRTLDPRVQFLAWQARRAPPLSSLSPADARIASATALALSAGDPKPGVRVESLSVPGATGQIPARAYRSTHQDPAAPLMVFAHFGGGVLGDLDTADAFCRLLAAGARCPVLSIDYRLAPEHRFPAGQDDMLAAYLWGRDNADRFGAPRGVAAVGGDSIGGGFAAVVAHDLRRAGEPQPALQLLICPALDMADDSPSMTTYAGAWPLSRATLGWFMDHYIGPDDAPTDPRLSPLRENDLSGLAPAIVIGAGFDPLLDQGEAYARRLIAAGTPATYRCWDALPHAFTALTGVVPAADRACHQIASLTRGANVKG